jgi:tRNA-specific 2-thiouridylase
MKINESRKYLCRIRYRQALTEASFTLKENGMEVLFNEDQRGITPGQFIAWYNNDELIGSGVIH